MTMQSTPTSHDLCQGAATDAGCRARLVMGQEAMEYIDSPELARRWNLTESWIRDNVRRRARDPIPHVRFGHYVRFEFESSELREWLQRHRVTANGRNGASRTGGKK
jgi:predicted DNA-binding transcriptional regulator AlpA